MQYNENPTKRKICIEILRFARYTILVPGNRYKNTRPYRKPPAQYALYCDSFVIALQIYHNTHKKARRFHRKGGEKSGGKKNFPAGRKEKDSRHPAATEWRAEENRCDRWSVRPHGQDNCGKNPG